MTPDVASDSTSVSEIVLQRLTKTEMVRKTVDGWNWGSDSNAGIVYSTGGDWLSTHGIR